MIACWHFNESISNPVETALRFLGGYTGVDVHQDSWSINSLDVFVLPQASDAFLVACLEPATRSIFRLNVTIRPTSIVLEYAMSSIGLSQLDDYFVLTAENEYQS
jgi:hypothetical protein